MYSISSCKGLCGGDKEMSYEIGCKLADNGDFIPHNEVMRECILGDLKPGEYYVLEVKKMTDSKKRTLPQNNAMYLFFNKLAKRLNDSGFDKRAVFEKMKKGFFISWSGHCVKQDLWRPIMEALTDKESTAKLTKQELSSIYENVNKFTVERLGFSEPFPSMDSLLFEQELKENQQ